MQRIAFEKPKDLVELLNSYSLENHPAPISLQRIFSMAYRAKCRTVFREEAVDNTEYRREWELFYSHTLEAGTYQPPDRLHFFRESLSDFSKVDNNDKRYLGFCDIRPLRNNRSIAYALIDQRVFADEQQGEYLFLVCSDEYEVPFPAGALGPAKTLHVRAFPYVQQDGRSITCAQAALVTVLSYSQPKWTGADITELAARFPTGQRDWPARGLELPEMGWVLKERGFAPLLYDYRDSPERPRKRLPPAEQLIYRYLESRIPVIVGIQTGTTGHALVVIGHTFSPDSWRAQSLGSYYGIPPTGGVFDCSTKWIERFVVQDDNFGPYMLISTAALRDFLCQGVVIPLPKDVFLTAEYAEMYASYLLHPQGGDLLREFLALCSAQSGHAFHPETTFWQREFAKHLNSSDIVLRTYLQDSSVWKDDRRAAATNAGYLSALDTYPFPSKVWVVELSWPAIFCHSRLMCGEVLIDPTSDVQFHVPAIQQAFLWAHIPGGIMWRDPANNSVNLLPVGGPDIPCAHRYTTRQPT